MANTKNQKPHAIMVSFHLQGHITPFVNLAIKLASKGFSITFADHDFVHRRISKFQHNATEIDIFAAARASGLDIRYTTFSDGFPLDFDRTDYQWLEFFRDGLPDKVDELVATILHSDSSTAPSNYFLIADTLSIWPKKIARKYGLVNVSFWTQPALVFSLYYHLELLREKGHVPVNGRREIVDYVPGIGSIDTRDFMSFLHDTELEVLHKIMFEAFDAAKSADLILCNTVQELEAETISALQQKHPFYAVGPLFPADFAKSSIATSMLPESKTSDWLNSRAGGSVLYVSFGSLAKTERNVIREIAGGLLLSEVNFIWVVRPGMVDSDGGGVLPEGFEEETRERGVVVPWCRQNEVHCQQRRLSTKEAVHCWCRLSTKEGGSAKAYIHGSNTNLNIVGLQRFAQPANSSHKNRELHPRMRSTSHSLLLSISPPVSHKDLKILALFFSRVSPLSISSLY